MLCKSSVDYTHFLKKENKTFDNIRMSHIDIFRINPMFFVVFKRISETNHFNFVTTKHFDSSQTPHNLPYWRILNFVCFIPI